MARDSSALKSAVVAVIPALNEAERVAATVHAARSIPDVRLVIVVDDGSSDATAAVAQASGAAVCAHERRRGKAAAMQTGADLASERGYPDAPLLFLDADLEDSAANAGPLTTPVLGEEADMTIAVIPHAPGGGGHGFVVRLATKGIERATGWTPAQPLNGQRCISRSLFDRVQPLARGFGVEVGLTIDALRQGGRVLECPVEIRHRVTGSSVRDQWHRLRQYRDVRLALARRR